MQGGMKSPSSSPRPCIHEKSLFSETTSESSGLRKSRHRPMRGTKRDIWILNQCLLTQLFPCSYLCELAAGLKYFVQMNASSQKILGVPRETTSNIDIWRILNWKSISQKATLTYKYISSLVFRVSFNTDLRMDYQLGKPPTWKKDTYPNIKDNLEERDLMKETGVNLKNF